MNKFFRFEIKYPVDAHTTGYIEKDLLLFGMRHDNHSGSDGFYHVSSLYFDTFSFSDYYDKVGGLIARKKIRARIYEKLFGDRISKVYLEIKEKYGLAVVKKRVCLDMNNWLDLDKRGWSALGAPQFASREECGIFRKILYEINSKGRRPQIFVTYKRKPYLYEMGSNRLRVTFDKDIEACRASSFPRNSTSFSDAYSPAKAVMEVKYMNYLPPFMKRIIRKYDLRRDAVSKYALGVEAAHRYHALKR